MGAEVWHPACRSREPRSQLSFLWRPSPISYVYVPYNNPTGWNIRQLNLLLTFQSFYVFRHILFPRIQLLRQLLLQIASLLNSQARMKFVVSAVIGCLALPKLVSGLYSVVMYWDEYAVHAVTIHLGSSGSLTRVIHQELRMHQDLLGRNRDA